MSMTALPLKKKNISSDTPFENCLTLVLDLQKDFTEPLWLTALREAGLSRYRELGFPAHKQEAWKYIDLRSLQNTMFEPVPANTNGDLVHPSLSAIQPHLITGTEGQRLVMVNSHQADVLSATKGLPHGVTLRHLDLTDTTASEKLNQDDVFERLLPQGYPGQEDDAFAALNASLVDSVVVLDVEKDVQLSHPVQLLFVFPNDQHSRMHQPRIVLNLAENSSAEVIVQMVQLANNKFQWLNAVVDIRLAKSAKLIYTLVQTPGEKKSPTEEKSFNKSGERLLSMVASRASLAETSQLHVTATTFGGDVSRHALEVSLNGEKAHCTLNGLSVLDGNSRVYNHANMHHAIPNCTSSQVYKNILNDSSESEFNGTIFVHRDAQHTDATQLNKNLLLSDSARALSRPQLQIDADDVKCAHGATVGQLEENELFYLASRGISKEVARCLLTYGFAEDVIQHVQPMALKNYLEQGILHQLGQAYSPVACFTSCQSTDHTHCEHHQSH